MVSVCRHLLKARGACSHDVTGQGLSLALSGVSKEIILFKESRSQIVPQKMLVQTRACFLSVYGMKEPPLPPRKLLIVILEFSRSAGARRSGQLKGTCFLSGQALPLPSHGSSLLQGSTLASSPAFVIQGQYHPHSMLADRIRRGFIPFIARLDQELAKPNAGSCGLAN